MLEKVRLSRFELAMCFSEALDLVSPEVVDHHKRVAYLALEIATAAGLPAAERETVLLAGLLHDIGAISRQERLAALRFEIERPHRHAEMGYEILRANGLFGEIADAVRYHHVPWDGEGAIAFRGVAIPRASRVLHLADRIAVAVQPGREVLGQVREVTDRILGGRGRLFAPELVGVFEGLAQRAYFWLDLVSPRIGTLLRHAQHSPAFELSFPQLLGVTALFGYLIDTRSRFTAYHSSGVASVAERLAGLAGASRRECAMTKVAGYLHDLGKLAVPTEILEKPGPLTPEEFDVVKHHPYLTCRILETVEGLGVLGRMGALHHEALDGSGYPFGHRADALPFGARVIAVADVFTALTEDRPYRPGMAEADLARTLGAKADDGALDPGIVALAVGNYEGVREACTAAQAGGGAFREPWGPPP